MEKVSENILLELISKLEGMTPYSNKANMFKVKYLYFRYCVNNKRVLSEGDRLISINIVICCIKDIKMPPNLTLSVT